VRLGGFAFIVLMLVLVFAAPAAAECGGVQRFAAQRDRAPGPPPLAVGDSVMLGAGEELAAAGFDVDARGCRQMSEGLDVLAARGGSLPNVVVVALGANWTIERSEIRRALMILGPSRVLGLVTPRDYGNSAGPDTRTIRAAGRRWPARVKVLDWVTYSVGHPEWFYGDGLHLAPGGQRAFTRLLSRAFSFTRPLQASLVRAPHAATVERFEPDR
jgi:hypothetical protein